MNAVPHQPSTLAPDLSTHYQAVRRQTEALCSPLETEDYVVQSMPDVSPPKWHLAHTSWFFEQFVLDPFLPGYQRFHPKFHYLFNSYYNTAGVYHPRVRRGTVSRPSVSQVYEYRHYVTEATVKLLEEAPDEVLSDITPLVTLGIHHEQQHQELLLTDIKHILWCNPLEPVYRELPGEQTPDPGPVRWLEHAGGVVEVGFDGNGFCFDNELPRHRVYLEGFRLADRLVTNAEFLAFMADGGYHRPELWLSDGWAKVKEEGWEAPLYWEQREGAWWHFTLGGMRPVDPHEPVSHVSHYEADAYARWAGKRLPTEFEWEIAAAALPVTGNFVEAATYRPTGQATGSIYGDLWQWTASAYLPYPGFEPLPGTVGEYNGKFMSNQIVLRGGSCATPQSHIRASYRNFFQHYQRWQFSGIRLAE